VDSNHKINIDQPFPYAISFGFPDSVSIYFKGFVPMAATAACFWTHSSWAPAAALKQLAWSLAMAVG
jgi:hypothetical protein